MLSWLGKLECVHAKKPTSIKHPDPSKWKDRVSIRTDCKVHVWISRENRSGGPWSIAGFEGQHNHDLLHNAHKFSPSVRALTDDLKAEVAHLTQTTKLSAAVIRNVIRGDPKHSGKIIERKAVDNAMRKCKRGSSNVLGNQAMDLFRELLQWKKQDPEWAVGFVVEPNTMQLDRVFWMAPEQRRLYMRYHDVVINDTTAQSNRLRMGLNVTAVIDNRGATRIVALALVRTEGGDDFKWILSQLQRGGGGVTPGVLLVDEDKAMELACRTVFPETQIVNCIWHVAGNFSKQLGKQTDGKARGRFWELRRITTEQEFEEEWSNIKRDYGSTEKAKKYLDKVYKRRFHWARPWAGTCFTAGAESTQRVEKAHDLIKSSLNSASTLLEVLQAVQERVSCEEQTKAHLNFRNEVKMITSSDVNESAKYFSSIIHENRKYLGDFGHFEMKKEMAASLYYEFQVHDEVRIVY